eukprot:1149741-Pelagomonas_calceolata.AAC.3
MREMLLTVRQKGPSGLYWGFLPHCFEALPHDISEMLVMGCMKVGACLRAVQGTVPTSIPSSPLMWGIAA